MNKINSLHALCILQFNPCHFSDLQLGAMLDDRKLSARALFDANSQRQILTGVRVEVGKSVCHMLPFHVFVSPYNADRQKDS